MTKSVLLDFLRAKQAYVVDKKVDMANYCGVISPFWKLERCFSGVRWICHRSQDGLEKVASHGTVLMEAVLPCREVDWGFLRACLRPVFRYFGKSIQM